MSRATMMTLAPFFARMHPALLPSPADPPVIRIVCPFHEQSGERAQGGVGAPAYSFVYQEVVFALKSPHSVR